MLKGVSERGVTGRWGSSEKSLQISDHPAPAPAPHLPGSTNYTCRASFRTQTASHPAWEPGARAELPQPEVHERRYI